MRAVRSRLGSVQVETQDGDDQLRLDPAADLRGVIDLHFLFLLFINFK